ncbi:MAG TPA: nucleotidyltransferase family protein [Limnochordia bacterium]|nr:nucleotidyltransferase family protein [Limnochordia bacterium]
MNDSGILRCWEAVVLAAGASTRMVFHKALMPWQGQPLVAHQVKELLATRARRVVVVLGAEAQEIAAELQRHVPQSPAAPWGGEPRLEIVVNPKWREGKSSSIRSGVAALSAEVTDLLLLTVDQPIRAEVLEGLMGAHEMMGKPVTLPGAGGRKGHPVALSAGLREELGSLQEEHQGLRALIRRLEKEGGVAVYEMAAPCIFWNFNRPEDAAIAHEPVRVRPVAFGRKFPLSGKSKSDWEVLE